jgi:uncharacterized damage-inducible protein DinB
MSRSVKATSGNPTNSSLHSGPRKSFATSVDKLKFDGYPSLESQLINAWRTNNRVTIFLIKNLPKQLWPSTIPGSPRRTVRSLAAHIHNTRCMWVKMIGKRHGVQVPERVDGRAVSQSQLARALERSSRGIEVLIQLGAERGGNVPSAEWQNFPTDLVHFLNYFVAHEAHHRGQMCMIARQLGHRLPIDVTGGLWQWKKHSTKTPKREYK